MSWKGKEEEIPQSQLLSLHPPIPQSPYPLSLNIETTFPQRLDTTRSSPLQGPQPGQSAQLQADSRPPSTQRHLPVLDALLEFRVTFVADERPVLLDLVAVVEVVGRARQGFLRRDARVDKALGVFQVPVQGLDRVGDAVFL